MRVHRDNHLFKHRSRLKPMLVYNLFCQPGGQSSRPCANPAGCYPPFPRALHCRGISVSPQGQGWPWASCTKATGGCAECLYHFITRHIRRGWQRQQLTSGWRKRRHVGLRKAVQVSPGNLMRRWKEWSHRRLQGCPPGPRTEGGAALGRADSSCCWTSPLVWEGRLKRLGVACSKGCSSPLLPVSQRQSVLSGPAIAIV